MGKKVKTGKSRKDKYYQLAKESGFRARSAFKLLQLNRKFNFLDRSRVCIDLCAAPGGWLQVAAKEMPMSSVIIGVDLVPIKPIRNVTTLTEDITTDKCRMAIRKEIQTWDVDVVLNDGAPNVGKNWIHDAFSQAQLTLSALKLATSFLRKGGWFVTKVFRSADYNALLEVFRQLFKKVYATKPKASRNESAEIFVVCQHYLKPAKVDAKLIDPRYVFKEAPKEERTPINLMHPEKRNKKADGYVEGDYTQHHRLSVLEFLASSNHLEQLATTSEIVLDDRRLANHELTTAEIKECCRDIKVLGKREIRLVLNWRKKLRDLIKSKTGKKTDASSDEEDEEAGRKEEKSEEGREEPDEEAEIDEQLKAMRDEETKEAKRKGKKVRQERAKRQKRLELKMDIPGDSIDVGEDTDLFKLKTIQNKQQLSAVEEISLADIDSALTSDSDDSDADTRRTRAVFDRNEQHDYGFSSGEEEEEKLSDGWEDEKDREEAELTANTNPRLVSLENETTRSQRNANSWFRKSTFGQLHDDDDEDVEISQTVKQYKDKGGTVLEKDKKKKEKKTKGAKPADDPEDSDKNTKTKSHNSTELPKRLETVKDNLDKLSDSSDYSDWSESESEIENEEPAEKKAKVAAPVKEKDGFEVVPANHPLRRQRLDAEGLALGAALAQSRKRRREVVEAAYNRYTFDDESLRLPDWFTEDESRHYFHNLPVTRDEVNEYKQREMGVDARPIKKIAEAKARKKRKLTKRLEKARKKAEAVSDNVDVTDQEKMQQIKHIYKKAGLLKQQAKKEVTYVVAKKGLSKKVSRPAGVKGKFKMVDPRMKKEVRQKKRVEKAKIGKGKKRHR